MDFGLRTSDFGPCLAAVLLLSLPAAARQATVTLTGHVSDNMAAPLSVARVCAATTQGSSQAVTAADGSYVFSDLREGTYNVYSCLPGFTTVAQKVTISGRGTVLDFVLPVAPICECLAPPDLPTLFKQADLVVRIKLTGQELSPGSDHAAKVAHTAHILTVWKRNPRVVGATVTFLQDLEGDCQPYQIGRDMVLFLTWDTRQDAFVRADRTVGAFTIESGHLNSSGLDRYSGKPVEELAADLDAIRAGAKVR